MFLAALALWFAPVCLAADGDSRTHGANNSVTDGNYPQQLGALLHARSVINLGVNGATSGDIRWSHAAPIPRLWCRNVMVLWVGANDRILGIPVSVTLDNIAAIVSERRSLGYQVIVLTEPPSSYAGRPPDFEDGRTAENEWIRAHVPFCDIAADQTLSHPEDPSVTSDGLHPTRSGYGIISLRTANCIGQERR